MKQPLEWIESGGGPLMFAPRSALAAWRATDYQRACAVTDEIDVISVGGAQALVLGDEPDRTALIARCATGVLFVRWRWAKSEESLLSALDVEQIDRLAFGSERVFEAVTDQYLLLDSACSGVEVVHAQKAELKAGPYVFGTFNLQPNADTCVLIHRLRAKARSS